MTKAAHLIASLLFVMLCGGLWFAWRIAKMLLAGHLGGVEVSLPMALMLGYYDWIWVLPVPAVAYSAVMLDRHEVLVEKVLVYVLVLACLAAVLYLGTAGLIGWELARFRGVSAAGH